MPGGAVGRPRPIGSLNETRGTTAVPPAASYVDLQVNGYAGADFNSDALTAEQLHAACLHLRADGVAGILATVVTDDLDRMAARVTRIAELRRGDSLVRDVIWGIHLEGPFINPSPGYVGAHLVEHVREADPALMRQLLDAAEGLTRLVTLAPECDPGLNVTSFLAARGVVVSAGHCDASLDELRAAIDAGLSMFTHLGNGCPALLPRHDNIIQRVLSLRDRLMICFIADGVHVPFPALGNYLHLAGMDRSIVVTDVISAAGLGPGRYTLGSQTINVGDDLVARSSDGSHFMGSTATMPRMAAALRAELGLTQEQFDAMAGRNPRRVLGRW
jgi:N-acetylglucosamine-6-phosphate deacetylase